MGRTRDHLLADDDRGVALFPGLVADRPFALLLATVVGAVGLLCNEVAQRGGRVVVVEGQDIGLLLARRDIRLAGGRRISGCRVLVGGARSEGRKQGEGQNGVARAWGKSHGIPRGADEQSKSTTRCPAEVTRCVEPGGLSLFC